MPSGKGKFVVASAEPSEYGWVRCYRDTRGETGYGGSSDIFTSSMMHKADLKYATHYETKEEAQAWAEEFLRGFDYKILEDPNV